jgi:hypothetical protein
MGYARRYVRYLCSKVKNEFRAGPWPCPRSSTPGRRRRKRAEAAPQWHLKGLGDAEGQETSLEINRGQEPQTWLALVVTSCISRSICPSSSSHPGICCRPSRHHAVRACHAFTSNLPSICDSCDHTSSNTVPSTADSPSAAPLRRSAAQPLSPSVPQSLSPSVLQFLSSSAAQPLSPQPRPSAPQPLSASALT